MLGRSRGGGTEAPKEEEAVRSEQKEFTTKAEYNRWLVRQQNAKMADEARDAAKAGEEIIKERQRRHTTQGLSRQQAAMVQMKRASESIEAHRQQNLTHGRKVYEEVSGWRVGAKAHKDEWSKYGQSVREATKKSNATAASIAELNERKKAQAAVTRQEDQAKEAEREKLKKQREKDVQAAAAAIKADTSDSSIDAAKRMFYEQRLKSANDTKTQAAAWAKERAEKKSTFQEAQNKRRNKSKAARSEAGKAREMLLTARASQAAELRAKKSTLSEQHKERMQSEYLEKAALVKGTRVLKPASSRGPKLPPVCTRVSCRPALSHPRPVPSAAPPVASHSPPGSAPSRPFRQASSRMGSTRRGKPPVGHRLRDRASSLARRNPAAPHAPRAWKAWRSLDVALGAPANAAACERGLCGRPVASGCGLSCEGTCCACGPVLHLDIESRSRTRRWPRGRLPP